MSCPSRLLTSSLKGVFYGQLPTTAASIDVCDPRSWLYSGDRACLKSQVVIYTSYAGCADPCRRTVGDGRPHLAPNFVAYRPAPAPVEQDLSLPDINPTNDGCPVRCASSLVGYPDTGSVDLTDRINRDLRREPLRGGNQNASLHTVGK